jgi:hypothetical protein
VSKPTAELRMAYTWTCDECGLDHFARAIAMAPEAIGPDDLPDGMAWDDFLAFSGGAGEIGGHVLVKPDIVTCPECKTSYRTEEA